MLLLSGVPVHVVAERLGHADPAVTLRVYAHVVRKHAAGVADLFAAAVDSTSKGADDDGDQGSDRDDDEGPEGMALVGC